MIFSTTPPISLEPERQRDDVEQEHVFARPGRRRADRPAPRRRARPPGRDRCRRAARARTAPRTKRRTAGTRVAPPTRMTPSSCRGRRRSASLSARRTGPVRAEDRRDQPLELGARHLAVRLRVASASRSTRRPRVVSRCLMARASSSSARRSAVVSRRVVEAPPLEQQQLGERAIEVVAAERGVAAGRLHLEHAAGQLQDRDVEGAAAEIVDGEGPFRLLVEPVGERRRRRLVQQPQHLEPGDAARVRVACRCASSK